MKLKKVLALVLSACMILGLLSACGRSGGETQSEQPSQGTESQDPASPESDTPAEPTGFAFSLEPVCSAVFSFFLVGEVLSPIAFLGAALILTGVMAATVELPRLRAHGQARMAGAPEHVS